MENHNFYEKYLNDLANNYLSYIKACKSKGTYICYQHHLKIIINWFTTNMLPVNKENLVRFISFSRCKNLTNKTINHRIIVLKAMFKYANIKTDIYQIKKLVVINKPFNYLDYNKIKELKNYITTSNISQTNKLILALLLDTGCRLRELINIEITNIDFKQRTILLTETKTKKPRYVFFTEFTEKFFSHIDLSKKYLFDYTEHGIYKIFYRANKHLSFSRFHPHMLRHTCATNLLKNGADLETVRQILGHTNIQQTQQYLHLDTSYIKSIYDKCMI